MHRTTNKYAQCCCLAALTVACAVFGVQLASGQNDRQKIINIKAAYLLRFLEYTQWPADSFRDSASPLIVTLVGDCDIYNVLRETGALSANPIGDRQVVLQRLNYPRPDVTGSVRLDEVNDFYNVLQRSHAVYFCSATTDALRPVLRQLEGRNILTVSDVPRFCDGGGMLGLVIRENRMVFQANAGEIKKTDLTVSAKMLKLAEIVQTQPSATSGVEVTRP